MKHSTFRQITIAMILLLVLALSACGGGGGGAGNTDNNALSGDVEIDGSSTVFPITQAVAEEFMLAHPDTNVTVGVSGTGGGFQRFIGGETDISDASREIRPEEANNAQENGIDFAEVPVAFDGITVVVHPDNDWVDHLTVEELKRIWEPGSTIETWQDLRPGWPAEEIVLYGPGTDSGTFDYFTEVVVGESGATRSDFTPSEDDNVLVQGVAHDRYALGYFGFAYYIENQEQLRAVPIDAGEGPVEPTNETIRDGSYTPLSRPLFIYVSRSSMEEKPQVMEFVRFYLTDGKELAPEVGYVKLPDEEYQASLAELGLKE